MQYKRSHTFPKLHFITSLLIYMTHNCNFQFHIHIFSISTPIVQIFINIFRCTLETRSTTRQMHTNAAKWKLQRKWKQKFIECTQADWKTLVGKHYSIMGTFIQLESLMVPLVSYFVKIRKIEHWWKPTDNVHLK